MKKFLEKIALFKNLKPGEYSFLAKRIESKHFKKDEVIFKKNDEAKNLYLVKQGQVKLYNLRKGTGKEEIVCVIRPGGNFCLAPLLSREKLHINAKALFETEVAVISKSVLQELIDASHQFSKNIITSLAGKECDLCEEVCDLSLSTTKERLAKYLVGEFEKLGGKKKLRLGLKQGQLASHLGTVRETLSRDMASLKKSKVIDHRKGTIALLDEGELIQIANRADKM